MHTLLMLAGLSIVTVSAMAVVALVTTVVLACLVRVLFVGGEARPVQ